MKKLLFYLTMIFLIIQIQGCVTPPSVKRGDDFLAKKNYQKAISAYKTGLSKTNDPALKKTIKKKIVSIKSILTDNCLADAEAVYNRQEKITVPAINNVIGILKQCSKWDDKKRIAGKIHVYRQEKKKLLGSIKKNLQKAKKESNGYNYDQAEKLISEALSIDPANQNLLKEKKQIALRKDYFRKIKAYLDKEDLENALISFNRLSNSFSTDLTLSKFPLKDAFISLISQKVVNLKEADKWYDAYALLTKWNLPELDEKLNEVRSKGSEYYYENAKSSIEFDNNHFKGYLYCIKANELNPKDKRVFELYKNVKDHVDKSMQRYIAIGSFDPPSNDPDAGKQFSDSLISYLYRVLPYGINIMERDKIDTILKEQKSAGDILGVNLIVTGTVSLFKVDTSIDKRTATIRVKIGEEIVENPAFMQMFKMYGKDMATWPSVPPKTIKKENHQLLNYTKGTAQLKGFAKVSVRIFDTKKGAITFVKDFDASAVASCEFQDEVKEAGIPYVPMSLPTNTEIKEQMRKKIVSEIAKIVQASFENREIRFLNQVNFFIDRREHEAALKPLATGHLYCILDNIKPDNKAFVEIKRLTDNY